MGDIPKALKTPHSASPDDITQNLSKSMQDFINQEQESLPKPDPRKQFVDQKIAEMNQKVFGPSGEINIGPNDLGKTMIAEGAGTIPQVVGGAVGGALSTGAFMSPVPGAMAGSALGSMATAPISNFVRGLYGLPKRDHDLIFDNIIPAVIPGANIAYQSARLLPMMDKVEQTMASLSKEGKAFIKNHLEPVVQSGESSALLSDIKLNYIRNNRDDLVKQADSLMMDGVPEEQAYSQVFANEAVKQKAIDNINSAAEKLAGPRLAVEEIMNRSQVGLKSGLERAKQKMGDALEAVYDTTDSIKGAPLYDPSGSTLESLKGLLSKKFRGTTSKELESAKSNINGLINDFEETASSSGFGSKQGPAYRKGIMGETIQTGSPEIPFTNEAGKSYSMKDMGWLRGKRQEYDLLFEQSANPIYKDAANILRAAETAHVEKNLEKVMPGIKNTYLGVKQQYSGAIDTINEVLGRVSQDPTNAVGILKSVGLDNAKVILNELDSASINAIKRQYMDGLLYDKVGEKVVSNPRKAITALASDSPNAVSEEAFAKTIFGDEFKGFKKTIEDAQFLRALPEKVDPTETPAGRRFIGMVAQNPRLFTVRAIKSLFGKNEGTSNRLVKALYQAEPEIAFESAQNVNQAFDTMVTLKKSGIDPSKVYKAYEEVVSRANKFGAIQSGVVRTINDVATEQPQ